jgi:proteasome lid subunit RPN8/RPN11
LLSTPFHLRIPRDIFDAMLAQAQMERPHECCGMLAGVREGDIGRVTKRYPYTNVAETPATRYEAKPRELMNAERDMRGFELVQLALYHSHPTSEPIPSKTDLALAFHPDSVYLIISLLHQPPTVRGWWLSENGYEEAEWACEVAIAPTENESS